MPRPARRYEIYLPLTFNDGRRIPGKHFKQLESRLLDRFGGSTSFPPDFPLRGVWRSKTQLYVDQVILISVLDFRPRGSQRFIAELKRDLLRDFDQLEILITETAQRVH
jgi:hypothetical protein